MLKLKQKWDEKYPKKSYISMQNLRDNAARLQKEFEMDVGSDEAQIELD